MPHRGRTYPYHPSSWATEAWFWPGLMPWKLYGQNLAVELPPWSPWILPGWTGVSSVGIPTADAKIITYDFPVTAPLTGGITVTCKRAIGAEGPVARWTISIDDSGHLFGRATLDQTFPQTIVFCPGFVDFDGFMGYGGGLGPFIEFRPATYAEGGSPWID